MAPDQALAWQVSYPLMMELLMSSLQFDLQGLAKFYEQQGNWENYVEVLIRLLDFSLKEFVDYLYFYPHLTWIQPYK